MLEKTPDFSNTEIAFRSRSNAELLRALSLFRLIKAPPLVKIGSSLLQLGFKLHLPLSPFVKWTVFRQFCGGESLDECRRVISEMAESKVQSILDYGAEGEKSESGFDFTTSEILKTAVEAKKTPGIPFIVFKFTGIASFRLLEKISMVGIDNLSAEEKEEWLRVQRRVDRICDAAAASSKPVMIDAEETWIQPAIDGEVERQMTKRNQSDCNVYTTIQLYRTDRLAYLEALAERARKSKWRIGVKLVRGAYIEKEREHATSQGIVSPICPTKEATDRAYDQALAYCFKNIDLISFCAGTHNENSCILGANFARKIPDACKDAVWFSQLYGMSDHLTYNLADCGFNVAKYVPYGPVQAVIPYLIRRAQENTSVAGQSGRELQMLEVELKRRKSIGRNSSPVPPVKSF